MHSLDPVAVAAIFVALALGGVVKGATGAGAPIMAVPVMAAFYDVRIAVILMVVPNVVTNTWQLWHYRAHSLPGRFGLVFALAGGIGTVIGTALLAGLPAEVLALIMSVVLSLYVALRLLRPQARLALHAARRIVFPVGLAGGILQGAAGMSAPVSLSFLNSMRLERTVFIATISALFAAMSVAQVPAMFAYGLLTPALLLASGAALLPVLMFMPVGSWLARRMSAAAFDRIVLALLAVLAVRLAWTALG